jgi:WD40 repeat protein
MQAGGPRLVNRWPLPDLAHPALRRALAGHTAWLFNPVEAVAISADGSWLASASEDGTVRIWDTATGSGTSRLGVVADGLAHYPSTAQASALRSANSRKVAGLRPVTFSTSPAGKEPWPAMMAPVSQRSMTA